ncbi:hypothetical protein PM082_022818 [Marasmius tenuissimus]|nr:hypothetical protein PM082_001918 [Marasmius tenuissimus]KAJ8094224.1 hypothetical protein PM082_006762 [Marasmius tenuissimus]KAJ8095711.1 hypothetical protein PM082_022818 [Marasmius tenuissimus]
MEPSLQERQVFGANFGVQSQSRCTPAKFSLNSTTNGKPYSKTEGWGSVYMATVYQEGLEEPFVVKVGRTSRPLKTRMEELRRTCAGHTQFEVAAFFVPQHIRTERIGHEQLQTITKRPIQKCLKCPRRHQELFQVEDRQTSLMDVVVPVLHASAHLAMSQAHARIQAKSQRKHMKRSTWVRRTKKSEELSNRHPRMKPYMDGSRRCPLYFLPPTPVDEL